LSEKNPEEETSVSENVLKRSPKQVKPITILTPKQKKTLGIGDLSKKNRQLRREIRQGVTSRVLNIDLECEECGSHIRLVVTAGMLTGMNKAMKEAKPRRFRIPVGVAVVSNEEAVALDSVPSTPHVVARKKFESALSALIPDLKTRRVTPKPKLAEKAGDAEE